MLAALIPAADRILGSSRQEAGVATLAFARLRLVDECGQGGEAMKLEFRQVGLVGLPLNESVAPSAFSADVAEASGGVIVAVDDPSARVVPAGVAALMVSKQIVLISQSKRA